jgi:hypothetical protein
VVVAAVLVCLEIQITIDQEALEAVEQEILVQWQVIMVKRTLAVALVVQEMVQVEILQLVDLVL